MILKMAGPWTDPKTKILYLRQRTPSDLLHLMGQKVTLPVAEAMYTVTIREVVQLSLRTKVPSVAKRRHATADAALRQFWDRARSRSTPAPQHAASDHAEPERAAMSWADAVERFAPTAALVLAESGIPDTDANRARIVAEAASIMDEVGAMLGKQRAQGMLGQRKPSQERANIPASSGLSLAAQPPRITVAELWERWKTYKSGKVAESTIRRYGPCLRSLATYVADRDIRHVTGDHIHAWAEHRRDKEGVKPSVINRVDLVAVSSVFGWATTRHGGRLIEINPVHDVQLDEPREISTRERAFRDAEVQTILAAALAVKPAPRNPTAGWAKRWCPWLAAYTGARIVELTSLRAEDIRKDRGVWVMHFRQTKTGEPRTVPLHEHLVEQGFLDFVSQIGSGPLFYDPTRHRVADATFGPEELRAQKLAKWLRKTVNLDPGLDPNHGWRHTFKTRALEVGIEQRIRDAITGHSINTVARDYEAPTISMMAEALARFPRYGVDFPGGP
jgi:integrase